MLALILVISLLVFYVGFLYYKSTTQKIELYFQRSNQETLSILEKCDVLFKKPEKVGTNGSTSSQAKYSPPLFLLNTHIHNIWAVWMRKFLNLKYKRDLIKTVDGGTLSIDWFVWGDKEFDQNTPTIVVLHGLTGGSHEKYVQHLADHAYKVYKWRTVVCNFRGCANTEVTTLRCYCAANTEDFRSSLSHVQKKIPNAPLFVVGFSLGSILCVKYLSETGRELELDPSGKKSNPFIAAASVSNPMNMIKSSKNLSLFWNRNIYQRVLTANLKRRSDQFVKFLGVDSDIDLALLMKSKSLKEIDERFTCKIFGYKNPEEYYTDASSVNHLHNVRTPLICINAIDDPFCPNHAIPFETFLRSKYALLATTPTGGHIGFLQNDSILNGPSFSDKAVLQFFNAHLQNHEGNNK